MIYIAIYLVVLVIFLLRLAWVNAGYDARNIDCVNGDYGIAFIWPIYVVISISYRISHEIYDAFYNIQKKRCEKKED